MNDQHYDLIIIGAGQSAEDKLSKLREHMQAMGGDTYLISMLDEIAWLLNLRGRDIDYNPVFISYCLVYLDKVLLCVDLDKLDDSVMIYLTALGVEVMPYESLANLLKDDTGCLLLDQAATSQWCLQQASGFDCVFVPSLIEHAKAIKNIVEIEGVRAAHVQDGLALAKFFCWLEQQWPIGVNEVQATDHLKQLRLEAETCVGLSFEAISGFADHGAIIHYAATPASAYTIDDSDLYLLDSGGQYLSGTTDITRTIHLGTPKAEHVYHYTLVLKGHLALAHAVFPEGTCGRQLDILARQFLWGASLNYAHGTGHGVGCYLCVHEGPIGISPSGSRSQVPLKPGMIISNEPGYYRDGHYGIRIENLLLVNSYDKGESGQSFLCFEDLVKVPYARNLIDRHSLTKEEIAWVDQYHQQILMALSPYASQAIEAWLQAACAPLMS